MEVKQEHLAKYTEPSKCAGSPTAPMGAAHVPPVPCCPVPWGEPAPSATALPWGAVRDPCVTDTAQGTTGSQCSTGFSHCRDGKRVARANQPTNQPHILCKEELSFAPLSNSTGYLSKKTGFKLVC